MTPTTLVLVFGSIGTLLGGLGTLLGVRSRQHVGELEERHDSWASLVSQLRGHVNDLLAENTALKRECQLLRSALAAALAELRKIPVLERNPDAS